MYIVMYIYLDDIYRRGINPPHRIKSISMSTFTTEEVDSLRMRGNAWCARYVDAANDSFYCRP
jgi:hypothetical protein